jgi:hypothetical protein
METRTFALTSMLLMFALAACPALDPSATQTSRLQAAGSGASGDAAPTLGPATSPPATATPNVVAAISDEADAGPEPALMPDEADAGVEPALMPDEADAGLDAGLTCRGQIVGSCAECVQDDAFCEPLSDGRWCTGPEL